MIQVPRILNEMSIRIFVGSRDIPKDVPTALKLLKHAQDNKHKMTEREKHSLDYFTVMLKRLNSGKTHDANSFWEVNEDLK